MTLFARLVFLSVVLVRHLVSGLSCKAGHFLNVNQDCIACPEHCLVCDTDEYCLYCDKGYWGKVCESSCSYCMAGTSCEKTNGFCKDGCTHGYSGLLCNEKCDNKCISCTRENPQNCLKCAPGRYPSVFCNKICSGCFDQNCNETGVCALMCVNGSWGQRCELKCSQHCKNDICDRGNGTCIFGCKDNSTGLQCHETSIGDENFVPVIPIIITVSAIALVGVVVAGLALCLRRNKKKRHRDSQPEEVKLVQGAAEVHTFTSFADHDNAGKSRGKDKKKLQHLRKHLQKEIPCRVIHKKGRNLYDCLSSCIGSLISSDDSSVATEELERFVSAKILQDNIVTLLKDHASSWKAMLPLLVDNFPLPKDKPKKSEEKDYLEYIEEFYTKLTSECSKGKYEQSYTRLCLYASATCINCPIYVISVDQQWHYFEPLFTFYEQPKRLKRYISMCVSPNNLFYKVQSTDRKAQPPEATGLVGMYMKCLEDTPTLDINVPDELRIPKSSQADLCNSVGEEVIKECCDNLLEAKLINKRKYARLITPTDRQEDFCRKITDSEDAFDVLCKVLIKRREKSLLSPYIEDLDLFVHSCEYLSQYEALTRLDSAVVERNLSVKSFVDACSLGEKELVDTRNKSNTVVIASSSAGIASGTLVLTGLALAPFTFGSSLGLCAAGGVLGIGTGVTTGTAKVVDAVKEHNKLENVEKIQKKMHEKELKVSRETENVENLFKAKLNKGHGSKFEGPDISPSRFLPVGSAVRTAHSVASIAAAAAKLGTKATFVSVAVLGPLSLAFDIAYLAQAVDNKSKGDKTDAADMLQRMSEIVDIKCKIFNNMLRGNLEDNKRMLESVLF